MESKHRTGKCEMYKGTICAPYIQDNVLIFVEDGGEKRQLFIEQKLKFGYDVMSPNLTKSCLSTALPLWCHHHFPQCSLVNSKAEPKSICKSECNLIQSKDCKAEYNIRGKAQSSEDDLFPDCQKLPDEDPLQTNCVSIKRHVMSLQPGDYFVQCDYCHIGRTTLFETAFTVAEIFTTNFHLFKNPFII